MKTSLKNVLIIDCYTVEPAGLGFPPYISTYARYAYGCFSKLGYKVYYSTIDDFRYGTNSFGSPGMPEGSVNPYLYSLTKNCEQILNLLHLAEWVVVISGDTVPSMHIQAINASSEEIKSVLSYAPRKCILYGPLAFSIQRQAHPLYAEFVASHTHTISPRNYLAGSSEPITYDELDDLLGEFTDLFSQIPWEVVAEIELYRGCTRKEFCSFCFEPIKNRAVTFRSVTEVIAEVGALYKAGVRKFRLGQQACFFSYHNRSVEMIKRLLAGIREYCTEIEVLHIDNVDPLAAASPAGRQIARLLNQYGTPGNCAPMGIESFDMKVIKDNDLTCTPEVLLRAMDNVEEYGSERTTSGLCKLLPGLNLIYGLPGETARTHEENLRWLEKIYSGGHFAGRTNIRQVAVYDSTPLVKLVGLSQPVSDIEIKKQDIAKVYDLPMKKRVFPLGLTLSDQHAFYRDAKGTWFRAYGSYPIMIITRNESYPLFEKHDLIIKDHEARYIYGSVVKG